MPPSDAYVNQILRDQPPGEINWNAVSVREEDCVIQLNSSHSIEKPDVNSSLIHQILDNAKLINGRFSLSGRMTPSFIERAMRDIFQFNESGFFINKYPEMIDLDPNIGYMGEICHYLATIVLAIFYHDVWGLTGESLLQNVRLLFPDITLEQLESYDWEPKLHLKPYLTEQQCSQILEHPEELTYLFGEDRLLDAFFYVPEVSDGLNSPNAMFEIDCLNLTSGEKEIVIRAIQQLSNFINNFFRRKTEAPYSQELTEQEHGLRAYLRGSVAEIAKVVINLLKFYYSIDWSKVESTEGSNPVAKVMVEADLSVMLTLDRPQMNSFREPVVIQYADSEDNKRITKRPLYAEFKAIVIELFGSKCVEFDDENKLVKFPFGIDYLRMQSYNRPDLMLFKQIEGETHIEITDFKRSLPRFFDEPTDMSILLYKLNAAALLLNKGFCKPHDLHFVDLGEFYNEETGEYNEKIIEAILTRIRFFYFNLRTGQRMEGLANASKDYIYKLLNTLRLMQELKIVYYQTIKQSLNDNEELLEFDVKD